MKKTIFPIIFSLFAYAAAAQSVYDAIAFSENSYYGTARSVAVGNAMTAIGGDMGSIGINPAGSAISGYNQLTITPGLSIASVGSGYDVNGNAASSFDMKTGRTKMNLPGAGVSISMSSGQNYGLKRLTFGFVINQTSNFNYDIQSVGRNARTSKAAEFASGASGISEDVLANYNSFNDSNVSWDLLAGYQGGMYAPPTGVADRYVGLTEQIGPGPDCHYVPGTLIQSSQRTKSGTKKDIIFNFGFDFSDRFYLGLNIGIPNAKYSYCDSFIETAEDMEQFPLVLNDDYGKSYTTYFKSDAMQYDYYANIAGIYGKIGFIFLPGNGFRLGTAIQSPTAYTITERWQYRASTYLSDDAFNDSQPSPIGEASYNLRSPYIVDLGIAYTFGDKGFLSADYELTDYSVMRFSSMNSRNFRDGTYSDLNDAARNFAGVSHTFRIGGEIKLSPAFSLRAGYNFRKSPLKLCTNSMGETVSVDDFLYEYYDCYVTQIKTLSGSSYINSPVSSYSAGLGYSTSGSFFVDVAFRYTKHSSTEYSPYYDYVALDRNGEPITVDNMGVGIPTPAPKITSVLNFTDIMLTLGWRF